MSESNLYSLLSTLGYPVAYDHFTTKTVSIPFILYRNDSVETFKADNKSYIVGRNYVIDLCTEKKDTSIETSLETLLNNNYLPFDKEEDFLEDEKIYQIRYFI